MRKSNIYFAGQTIALGCVPYHVALRSYKYNRPFSAGGHLVQNLKYWRAKECGKTPLGNVNKEKSHFPS